MNQAKTGRKLFIAAYALGLLLLVNYTLAFVLPFSSLETRIYSCLLFGAVGPMLHGIVLFLVFRIESKPAACALGIYVFAVYLAFAGANMYLVYLMGSNS